MVCCAPAIVLFAVSLAIYKDFGVSWDERILERYGEKAVDYYFSIGADKDYLELGRLKWHGAMAHALAAMQYSSAYTNKYEIRHLVGALTGVLAVAGAGRMGEDDGRAGRPVAALALTAAILAPSVEMARMHPYQYAYFNFIAGGALGAEGRFETEYWITSYKEGVEWIARNTTHHPGFQAKVLVAANGHNVACATAYAPSWMEIVTTEEAFGKLIPPKEAFEGDIPPGFDYYMATYRHGLSGAFSQAEVVHAVGRDGAVFTVVKRPRAVLTMSPGRPPGG